MFGNVRRDLQSSVMFVGICNPDALNIGICNPDALNVRIINLEHTQIVSFFSDCLESLLLVPVEFFECPIGIFLFWRGNFLGFHVNLHDGSSIQVVLRDGRPLW